MEAEKEAGQLLSGIPNEFPEELVQTLCARGPVRIERICSRGHSSPEGFWYDQEQDEWVAVISGAARLEFADGEVREMTAGDWVMIAAHRRHRVSWTAPDRHTVWLAVHLPPKAAQ